MIVERQSRIDSRNVSKSDQEDQPAIPEKINSQKLACQLCKAPLRNFTDVSAHVEPSTPERIRKLGYPLPPNI